MGDKPVEGIQPPQKKQEPATISRRKALAGFGAGIAGGLLAGIGLGNRSSGTSEQAYTPPVINPNSGTEQQPSAPAVNPSPIIHKEGSLAQQPSEYHVFPQKRPDGSREFSQPITEDEKKKILEDIDIVAENIKMLIDATTLQQSGIDVEKIAGEMKAWDDKKLTDWSQRFSSDRIFGDQEQELFLPFGETNLTAGFVKDRKTGEITYRSVGVIVDSNGNYAAQDTKGKPFTSENSRELPSKLLPLIKAPNGSKPDYSHEKLTWNTTLYPNRDTKILEETGSLNSSPYYTADNKLFRIFIDARPGDSAVQAAYVRTELYKPGHEPAYRGKGGEQP